MRYKKTFLGTLAFISLILPFIFGASAQAQNKAAKAAAGLGPRLTLAEAVHEAGQAAPGSTISHDFIIENTGDKELQIQNVTSSCGCTVADYDKMIGPGRTGKVTLRVKLYDDWSGRKITQSAIIESNDTENKYTTVVIKADVSSGD